MNDAPQVIVVGSGPAGVSAAWPMVRAGLRVLMLDASTDTPSAIPRSRPLDEFRTDPQAWKDRFGEDLSALACANFVSPKFSTPQARIVLGGFAERLGISTSNFLASGSLGQGGLSKIWGALAVPFDEQELAHFPRAAAAELMASYDAVSARIGVSGGPNRHPDEVSHAPARALLVRQRRYAPNVLDLQAAPNAVLEAAHGARKACTQCGLCLYGCSRGSIYDSAQEIPMLQRFANFCYRRGHLVRSLHSRDSEHVVMFETAEGRSELRAPIVVLAAGTIATTDLVMRRLRFVSRPVRLLSNPAAVVAFAMPTYIGRDLPTRALSLGQLFYRLRGSDGGAAGVVYGADALPLDQLAARLPVARPFALRLAHALAPALLMTTCYVPGSFSENTIRVHSEGDARIIIEGTQTPAATANLRRKLRELKRAFLRLGAVPVPGSTTILQPGADAHYAGTLPMGGTGPLATSAQGELIEGTGIFVADGAALPVLPAAHLTMTIMANADRIGNAIVRRTLARGANSGTALQAIA
jgi:choline dehydrogenase-like flavoprotein